LWGDGQLCRLEDLEVVADDVLLAFDQLSDLIDVELALRKQDSDVIADDV
jgi:hypothetical protein